ncbi:MAG: RuvX/YqgF family protein, partial [Candidatus Sulfotelmatobacter sp.]
MRPDDEKSAEEPNAIKSASAQPPVPPGRILGLDVGARRIGLAVSDPLGITAQGLDTLQRRNKRT